MGLPQVCLEKVISTRRWGRLLSNMTDVLTNMGKLGTGRLQIVCNVEGTTKSDAVQAMEHQRRPISD